MTFSTFTRMRERARLYSLPNRAFASLLIVVEANQPGFLVIAINGSKTR